MPDEPKSHHPLRLVRGEPSTSQQTPAAVAQLLCDRSLGIRERKRMFERYVIVDALGACEHNLSHAAKLLQISRTTMQSMVKKHGIDTGRRPRKTLKKLRMLFVDDDAKWRATMLRRLKGRFEIDVAIDGAGAIQMLRAHDYDIILCDIYMPNGDGTDVYSFLVRHKPSHARKLVFVSGILKPDAQLERIMNSDSAPVFLPKPFEFEELNRVLTNLAEVEMVDGSS